VSICRHDNCDIRPSYNAKGLKTPVYCFLHKDVKMVDVISDHWSTEFCNWISNKKRDVEYCTTIGCEKVIQHHFVGNKEPKYCPMHFGVTVYNKDCYPRKTYHEGADYTLAQPFIIKTVILEEPITKAPTTR
jgi:hypothetical protein